MPEKKPDFSALYKLVEKIGANPEAAFPETYQKRTPLEEANYYRDYNRDPDILKAEKEKVYQPPIDVAALTAPSTFVPAQSTTSANGTQGMEFNSMNTQTGARDQAYKSIPAPAIKPAAVEQPKTLAAPVVASTAKPALPTTDKPGEPMDLSWLANILGVAEAGGKGYLGDKTPGYLAKKGEEEFKMKELTAQGKQQDALESKRAKNRLAEILASAKARSQATTEDELFQ